MSIPTRFLGHLAAPAQTNLLLRIGEANVPAGLRFDRTNPAEVHLWAQDLGTFGIPTSSVRGASALSLDLGVHGTAFTGEGGLPRSVIDAVDSVHPLDIPAAGDAPDPLSVLQDVQIEAAATDWLDDVANGSMPGPGDMRSPSHALADAYAMPSGEMTNLDRQRDFARMTSPRGGALGMSGDPK